MESKIIYSFNAAVRGYHYYKSFCSPEEQQLLYLSHKEENPFGVFAIKSTDKKGNMVGHLPMEISRISKFLIDRGALMTGTLSSTRYRRSPLAQGGLEIPCIVKVQMPPTQINNKLIEWYKQLVEEYYSEPPNADDRFFKMP